MFRKKVYGFVLWINEYVENVEIVAASRLMLRNYTDFPSLHLNTWKVYYHKGRKHCSLIIRTLQFNTKKLTIRPLTIHLPY